MCLYAAHLRRQQSLLQTLAAFQVAPEAGQEHLRVIGSLTCHNDTTWTDIHFFCTCTFVCVCPATPDSSVALMHGSDYEFFVLPPDWYLRGSTEQSRSTLWFTCTDFLLNCKSMPIKSDWIKFSGLNLSDPPSVNEVL